MSSVTFTVDDDAVVRALNNAISATDRTIGMVADAMEQNVRIEAGHYSHRLAAPWHIVGAGPTERLVVAPEWWAHFIAGGTKPHGPTDAPMLVFEVDGEVVYAGFVQGIPATHFDEAAINRTRGELNEIFNRVIAEAT